MERQNTAAPPAAVLSLILAVPAAGYSSAAIQIEKLNSK